MSREINLATVSDTPALSALLSILFTQEAEFQPDTVAQQRGLNAILSDPALGEILVARQNGQIVGMVNVLYSISTALGARVALLEDMVVVPAMRGSGLGSQLLAAAIKHAKQRGCLRITLLTDADNYAAQAFYQKQGFEKSSMIPLRLALNSK